MKIVALTGSIGMGKTTTAAMFADLGVPIWDADRAVHRLYSAGGLGVAPIADQFPEAITKENIVDRAILSKLIVGKPEALARLEAIIHPLVGQDRASFLATARAQHHELVIVDVPLLFETGGEAYVDKVIVVSCAPDIQRERVLARPGMNEEKFAAILARQWPDAQKRAKADFVITTDHSLEATRAQVTDILKALSAETNHHA